MSQCYSRRYCPSELKKIKDYHSPREILWEMGSPLAPTQTWAEFGVGCGNSARRLSKLLSEFGQFYLFDGWEGIPDDWKLGDHLTERAGKWKFPKFKTRDDRFTFVDGWYEDTLPFEFPGQLGLVHIDCDVYSSTRTVLGRIDPWIGEGTVLIFDEIWGYQNYADHEYKAYREWCEEFGRKVEWVGRNTFDAVGIVC